MLKINKDGSAREITKHKAKKNAKKSVNKVRYKTKEFEIEIQGESKFIFSIFKKLESDGLYPPPKPETKEQKLTFELVDGRKDES
jgi:hypothetical protein